MRESVNRVESALHGDDLKDHLVARRVLESTKNWALWEDEHSSLMRQVADTGALQAQAISLRHAALRLIHVKALFEHLRTHELRGDERMRILLHFHPVRSYEHAMIAEHSDYLRKSCSYLCTSHIGADLVGDAAFLDPMQHYEKLYAEYLEIYCSTHIAPDGIEPFSEGSLLPLLKHQMNEWRWAILNPRASRPQVMRESEIRRPIGDTQRLPKLKNHPKAT